MRLCSAAPSGKDSPAAGRNPPARQRKKPKEVILLLCISLFHLFIVSRISHLCRPRNGPDLGVEVCALREVLNHHRADVMQQGLLMNRVLHLRNLLQICELEAFSLNSTN